MSWDDYHRRTSVQDAVLADVAETGLWRVPAWWLPEVEQMFGGEASFVQSLYPRWFAALAARLDAVLEEQDGDAADAAARAARRLAREHRALFGLLASYSDRPALEAAHQRERQYLYWAPGAQLAALAPQLGELVSRQDEMASAASPI